MTANKHLYLNLLPTETAIALKIRINDGCCECDSNMLEAVQDSMEFLQSYRVLPHLIHFPD